MRPIDSQLPTPVPQGTSLIQLNTEKGWVELPKCSGKKGEVKLMPEKENATVATCQDKPKDDVQQNY